jgi:hypothetical protein
MFLDTGRCYDSGSEASAVAFLSAVSKVSRINNHALKLTHQQRSPDAHVRCSRPQARRRAPRARSSPRRAVALRQYAGPHATGQKAPRRRVYRRNGVSTMLKFCFRGNFSCAETCTESLCFSKVERRTDCQCFIMPFSATAFALFLHS